MTETLIRRDLPIPAGRKLRFTFTIAYEADLDENVLPDGPMSLAELEQYLGDGTESLWRELHDNYDRDILEHTVELADVYVGHGSPLYEHRFELEWERKVREGGSSAGDELLRRSRTWLDEIPEPSKGGALA